MLEHWWFTFAALPDSRLFNASCRLSSKEEDTSKHEKEVFTFLSSMKTIGLPSLHWLYTRSPFLDADYAAFRGMLFTGEPELRRFVSDEASALRRVGSEPQSFSKDLTIAINFASAKAQSFSLSFLR